MLRHEPACPPDPFVKVQLVAGLKLVKTKKTSCLRGTIDPTYNESFSFRVSHQDLREVSLVFTGEGLAGVWVGEGERSSSSLLTDTSSPGWWRAGSSCLLQ